MLQTKRLEARECCADSKIQLLPQLHRVVDQLLKGAEGGGGGSRTIGYEYDCDWFEHEFQVPSLPHWAARDCCRLFWWRFEWFLRTWPDGRRCWIWRRGKRKWSRIRCFLLHDHHQSIWSKLEIGKEESGAGGSRVDSKQLCWVCPHAIGLIQSLFLFNLNCY